MRPPKAPSRRPPRCCGGYRRPSAGARATRAGVGGSSRSRRCWRSLPRSEPLSSSEAEETTATAWRTRRNLSPRPRRPLRLRLNRPRRHRSDCRRSRTRPFRRRATGRRRRSWATGRQELRRAVLLQLSVQRPSRAPPRIRSRPRCRRPSHPRLRRSLDLRRHRRRRLHHLRRRRKASRARVTDLPSQERAKRTVGEGTHIAVQCRRSGLPD